MKIYRNFRVNFEAVYLVVGLMVSVPGFAVGRESYLGLFAPFEEYCALELQLETSSQYLYAKGVYNPRASAKCRDTRWYTYTPSGEPRYEEYSSWIRVGSKKTCELERRAYDWFIQTCKDNTTHSIISRVDYYLFERR